MPGPNESSPAELLPDGATDDRVTSLLWGPFWLGDSSGTHLTYSFHRADSVYATDYSRSQEPGDAYSLTDAQAAAAKSALDAWSAVADIKFTEVQDTPDNVGDIRFGGFKGLQGTEFGQAYAPGTLGRSGDVWIGPNVNAADPAKGTDDYLTFMHETGHALGLKHSFEASQYNDVLLDAKFEDARYTIMSYTNNYSFKPTTPMLLDVAAMQFIYGANTHYHTGDDVYKWAPGQSVFETIWDAGGKDTIDASNQEASVKINLNEGEFSTIGKAFLDYNANPDAPTSMNSGLAIAYGAHIENAIGSAFNDTLIGNDLDNVLNGRGGLDTMIGGLGNDTYVIDQAGELDLVQEKADQGVDTLKITYDNTSPIAQVINLNAGTLANFENVHLKGEGAFTVLGNDRNNTLTGNDADNVLFGGAGNDKLVGGQGADIMTGGSGADRFVFNNLSEMGKGHNSDVITDFNSQQGDKLSFLKMDANVDTKALDAFSFIGSGEFTGAGQLRFADHVLSGNVNADLHADFEIQLVGVTEFHAHDLAV
ncbi:MULTISPECIES: M10 family metallopeptidase [Pseudomonas]|uniref:Hemolysin-type calcium-binding region:peptidase M10A and M12B, matrixin and adamalysin n=6 Tax=Pseudomonas syringae group TaxID=136849 RepID=F3G642_PSESJ|nr:MULTISPECIES: M10 family metallopeptidase [Pseudomonas]EGH42542.1 hemolysin-type calcium-binding region:peptidase M10A and M12B, matrixin and adamalysin [Pseudomonas syringae pv. pisi str. 1704B]KFF82527.1 metalloprotease [Pseudomonas syringae pv. syringae]KPZ03242.1 Hemolysin-type calcium-binding region:peptidase M10A and M12B, matrixin and adamalysin [Pseudomonas syringae pv. aptata]MBI6674561.1 M10 family metallopeptidase C-terminal domain-containing protein [Pseudomonas syringae]MBI6717